MTEEVFQDQQDALSSQGGEYVPYSKKEPENYKEIVITQIGECRRQLSRYLVEGGLYFVREKGQFIPKNIEDQWEINERCVNQLHDLMLHYFDDKAKDNIEKIDKDLQTQKDNLIAEYLNYEKDPKVKNLIKNSKDLILTKDDPFAKAIENRMRKIKDNNTRLKYRELLLLFKRKNDLSTRKALSAYDTD